MARTYREFMDNNITSTSEEISESRTFKKVSSGLAASKVHHLKGKVASTSDIATKLNVIAEMISVQTTLFFARDLMGGKS